MRTIKARIGKGVVYFSEYHGNKSLKAGRLEVHDFWKWLEEKERIYEELVILIAKTSDKQEISIT